jgi:CubicO group peptidase (beta-lactamase class C family)
MTIRLAFLFWVFSACVWAQPPLSTADPLAVGMEADRLSRIDSVVEEAIARGDAPGAVVLVGHQGSVVYRKAFGRRSVVPVEEPMTAETIFDAASLTKVVATATSIMILSEEGRVSFSDPAVLYIPEFGQNQKDRITLLQLLTHYSGLRADLDLNVPWQGYQTGMTLAAAEKLVAVPGEKFIYSDINYLVLADIVRRVTGSSLAEFAAERIFRPLGMTDTGFVPDSDLYCRIAPSELRDGHMIRGAVHDPTAFRVGGIAGHAGMFTTVDDLAIYAQMLLNRGIYDGQRVLSPLGVITMTTPQSPLGMAVGRGIGFDIRSPFSSSRGDLFPSGSFGHTGFTGTSLWIDPFTETFVIVFTNRLHPDGKGNAGPLRKRIASIVAASILEIPRALDLYHRY